MMLLGRGARPHDRLPRHRADVDLRVRAGRPQPAERAAAEGALKYFLLGAFSTAFLLYGIALVYGATGTTNLTLIGAQVRALDLGDSPMLLVGIALLLVGFGFKVAAAPFHMWAPDVYEGAPTPITAYMAAAVKAAAFAAFLRVLARGVRGAFRRGMPSSGGSPPSRWSSATWSRSGAENLKRMLAYSSVAHAGYLLVAVSAGTGMGRRRSSSICRVRVDDAGRVRAARRQGTQR